MSAKYSQTRIHQFIRAYVESKQGELNEQSDEIFTIQLPKQTSPIEYTYEPAVAREKKAVLMSPGSPAFQQILKECQENGVLCQITLQPKAEFEEYLKKPFKDSPFSCENCHRLTAGEETISVCPKPLPCFHQINNAKISSVKILKKEPARYFLFYYLANLQSKLRPKSEEILTFLLDETGCLIGSEDFSGKDILGNEDLLVQDSKGRLAPTVFDELKEVADEAVVNIVREKAVLFDLPLLRERKAKLRSFERRLRRQRHEQAISKKQDFDLANWQDNCEALLKREEESLATNASVKYINLLIINTTKIRFEVNLNNNSTIHAAFTLGISQAPEVTCSICRKPISEGYATQDALYVCKDCIRQSVDTAKIYSTKAPLRLDEKLREYFEADSGFVCSVCGKKHSRLLEFKCSHDNSSVCIYHYDLCDVCGKTFSKLNLSSTDEFRRHLCPKHASLNSQKEP